MNGGHGETEVTGVPSASLRCNNLEMLDDWRLVRGELVRRRRAVAVVRAILSHNLLEWKHRVRGAATIEKRAPVAG